jgi:hypothetical protein
VPKKRKNPFGLSDRLYRIAKKQALQEHIPLSTYVHRHGLHKLEDGIRSRHEQDRAKATKPRVTARANPKEISTPIGGQPGWRRK